MFTQIEIRVGTLIITLMQTKEVFKSHPGMLKNKKSLFLARPRHSGKTRSQPKSIAKGRRKEEIENFQAGKYESNRMDLLNGRGPQLS